MPQSISAKKTVRQNAKIRALNHWRKNRIKDQSKSFLEAIAAKNVDLAETEFKNFCGLIDQIACTSTLHKNTAARRKSRFSRKLKDLKQA